MGTRNLTVVYKNGEYKVAQYGQWDGYPEGLGITLLNFLKNVNMDSFRNAVDNVSFYTEEEIKEIRELVEERRTLIPNYDWSEDFPQLSRDTGGYILNLITFKGVNKVDNSINFAADSLFCEWAYVIDLDKNTFEVYEGFNEKPLGPNERFNFLKREGSQRYYPVKLCASFDLLSLPTQEDFLSTCEPPEEDKEFTEEFVETTDDVEDVQEEALLEILAG